VLDRHRAAAAVVSLFDSGATGGDGDLMRMLARESNQFYAELLTRHPRRFGAFAVLPFPDVDAALAELAQAWGAPPASGGGLDRCRHARVAICPAMPGWCRTLRQVW
jgi:hypothetical protein